MESALRAEQGCAGPRRCAWPPAPRQAQDIPPKVAPSLRGPALHCVGVSPKHTEFWNLNTSLLELEVLGVGRRELKQFQQKE